MKIIILSGNHSRHLFVHQAVLESGVECAAIAMEREDVLPEPPTGLLPQDHKNFIRHFKERYECEGRVFGELKPQSVFSGCQTLYRKSQELNSSSTADFVTKFKPDMAFIFGTDLVKEPLLSALPADRINLHLGLSPWYRGSATLFWPFYFLQPQFAGATFHQILPEADAGAILHQCVPDLFKGDGIHDVGARTVVKAREDLKILLNTYNHTGSWEYQPQKTTGRLFLSRDFESAHLRVIYDQFNNAIVDEYLNGSLGNRKPQLVQHVRSI